MRRFFRPWKQEPVRFFGQYKYRYLKVTYLLGNPESSVLVEIDVEVELFDKDVPKW